MPLPPNRPRRAPDGRLVALAIALALLVLYLLALADQGERLEVDGAPETSTSTTVHAYGSTPEPLGVTMRRVAAAVRWLEAQAPTTTTAPPVPSPSAGETRRVAPGPGGGVSSTAYCLTGNMANGSPARRGAVAANRWPIGTRLRVSPSPVGEIVTVEDRIGSGSELDFALPGDCAGARAWGRRAVTVEVLS